MASDSLLGYALLGLLHQGPRSGYDLRKTFALTPMGHFSDSPGAIYPALRRLVRRGWIASSAAARGGRRRRLFEPTAAGRKALAAWLELPATREEVVGGWDVLMLRLAFMSENDRPARLGRFLDSLDAALRGYLEELEAFLANEGKKLPLSARLAFESGIEGYRAQARWVVGAKAQARRRRRST
jgi:DNA-binding PadR family transcriptional regulator